MPDVSTDAYLDPYRESLERHGPGFEATMWASPRTQEVRFEVLAQMVNLAGRRVLDAGCSRGDFAAYLLERGIAFESYTGIDALPSVIDAAIARRLPRCEFLVRDFLRDPHALAAGRPEVICISGTLNTMDESELLRALEAAWRAATLTLAFNFLSDRAGERAVPQTHPVRRHDTGMLLEWAFSKTSRVSFTQDYFAHGHDATLVMSKER